MSRLARVRPSFDQAGSFLLALVLALVVWVVAEQQQNPVETRAIRRIPVTVHNLPGDLILIDSGTTPTVDIEARATRSTWDRLNTSDMLAYVDLSAATAGRHELPVVIDPPEANVEVLAVTPSAAVVRLESRVEQQIAVAINVLDQPAFGYVAGRATATPATVRVAGAKSLVDTVAEAEVRVRVADARADIETTEFVTLRDRSGAVVTGLEVDPRTVTVSIPISQRQGVSEKSVLPRVQGQPAANYRLVGISADPATVTLIGDPAALEALPSFVETTPITIENATGDIEERVPLVLPETVSAATSQSVVVRIAIEPKPNEPMDHAYLPTIGHALAIGALTSDPKRVGCLIESAHAILAGLDPADEIDFACSFGKLWSLHLNDQNGLKFDQDRPFGCTNLRSAFDQVRALERNGYGKRGEFVCFDVHPFRTTKEEHWMDHLTNSRRTFLRLVEKARSFDEKTAKQLIANRDYAALDQLVLEHLMGV